MFVKDNLFVKLFVYIRCFNNYFFQGIPLDNDFVFPNKISWTELLSEYIEYIICGCLPNKKIDLVLDNNSGTRRRHLRGPTLKWAKASCLIFGPY
jgi:hypothetical protein